MRIAVLGVGLIGGSIGMAAARRAQAQVCGYDPDGRVLAKALELGAIETAAADVAGAVEGADVVFVAAPVGALGETVRLALESCGPGCVVSDVGSTKRVVVADAGADERFIGGHPLAGAETAGVEHAREDLFEGAVWYLTPAMGSTAGVLYERLHRLLTTIGAQPTAIDADTHDRLMAAVSQLPHGAREPARDAGRGHAERRGIGRRAAPTRSRPVEIGRHGRLPAVGPSFRDATRVAVPTARSDGHLHVQQRCADRRDR